MPMTSPVDFISGPKIVSAPGKRPNGMTASLQAKCPMPPLSSGRPSDAMLSPAMMRAAHLASGTPVALLTNGTVREARGLTSMT